jgi:predicted alpha/beta superfamily hydrolase
MNTLRKLNLAVALCGLLTPLLFSQEGIAMNEYTTEYVPYVYQAPWRGNKIDTLFPSKVLGYDKNVTVFLPEKFGWHPDEKYALIIMYDRQDVRIIDDLLKSVDLLESYGQIPRTVVVGIQSGRGPDQRRREAKWGLDGSNAYGQKYDEFVFDELLPHVIDKFRIDKNQVIVYGHSWFGYHTSMILLNHIPELFGVISASPCCPGTMLMDDIVKAVAGAGPLERKFFLRIASGHDIGDDLNVYRDLTGKISLARLPENVDYKPTWFHAAMHMEVPGLLFRQALYEIYSDWADLAFAYADPENCPSFNDEQLYDSLQALSDKKYGFRIPIYDRHLMMRVEYYRYIRDEDVRNRGMIATWKFMVLKYGETPELFFRIAETYQRMNDPIRAGEYLKKAKDFKLDEDWKKRVKELDKKIRSL